VRLVAGEGEDAAAVSALPVGEELVRDLEVTDGGGGVGAADRHREAADDAAAALEHEASM